MWNIQHSLPLDMALRQATSQTAANVLPSNSSWRNNKKKENTVLKTQNEEFQVAWFYSLQEMYLLLYYSQSKKIFLTLPLPYQWSVQTLGFLRPISFVVCLHRGGNQSHASCSAAGPPQISCPWGKMQDAAAACRHPTKLETCWSQWCTK